MAHEDGTNSVLVAVLVIVGLIIVALVFMNYRGDGAPDGGDAGVDIEGTMDLQTPGDNQ